ncbi:MAG: bifunctional diaminohydroxyphosphoribosylaminopyrimidine deaminase/5-amino-6-(5-phosphoribosylamino)uracil reductase RibD [Acidobacteriota bacterium]
MSRPVGFEPEHERWMRRALALAARGRGLASPNPLVGAVVVKDGVVVGEGYHRYDRVRHAEVIALEQAGERAAGADLYVTLEPCCHTGRTPPCVDAIIRAQVRRVFVATRDPNPQVQGRGVAELRRHGVEVRVGLLQEEAASLNRPFFFAMEHHRPWVTLKLAMTLDGCIAAWDGSSRWITGELSRRSVHRLRFEADAVLVGVGTVLVDDPSLDVRGVRRKRILKVILDSNLRIPSEARLFSSQDPVLIFHGPDVAGSERRRLAGRADLVGVRRLRGGLDWRRILEELDRRQIRHLLIEGGSRVATSLLAQVRPLELVLFFAPKLLGAEGVHGIGSLGKRTLADAPILEDMSVRRSGEDFVVRGLLRE